MALSLYGERSVAAATPASPLSALVRWMAKARAERARRVALTALLDLDHDRLDDLGISRSDIVEAMQTRGRSAGSMLNAARARRARL
ncbi:hypothetical protein VW29_12045 [Devosia limi DSM 17137]|uniref:DUF1127 domain-containing protein n=1 Tax=Devosia limi DSM 17137 TaxID=1121477 RepID=A0A0F5LP53_9HYPH|nr:hypothetical protein [Devosia limi]KKB84105.1 hypothetical protein VW29_12045 [Devosia limi DSM 17137]SHF91548.1 hypothetical protein SAMN02745223_03878 [Devosia limi DSM 17137]